MPYVDPRIVAEREQAIRAWHAKQLSDYQISAQLGLDRSTVQTYRKRLGLPAVPQPVRTLSGERVGKHKKPSDIRNSSNGSGYVEPWRPRAVKAQPVTYWDLRHGRPAGRFGCRAYDGLWWDGNIRASGAPYTSPFADNALTFDTEREAQRMLEQAGFGDVLKVEEVRL